MAVFNQFSYSAACVLGPATPAAILHSSFRMCICSLITDHGLVADIPELVIR